MNGQMPNEMTTLSKVMENLKKEGYTVNFNLCEDHLEDDGKVISLHPVDFQIDRVYRFEGMSDPDDNSILYAISARNGSEKGILVNAYGVYSDSMSQEMIQVLSKAERARR